MVGSVSSNPHFLNYRATNPLKESIGMNVIENHYYKIQTQKEDNNKESGLMEELKIREIAIKIARNEKVSQKDINLLKEENPGILAKAKTAQIQAKQIQALKQSGNVAMKEHIQAYVQSMSVTDPEFSELFAHAMSKYEHMLTADNIN